jgi:hypothetical protein
MASFLTKVTAGELIDLFTKKRIAPPAQSDLWKVKYHQLLKYHQEEAKKAQENFVAATGHHSWEDPLYDANAELILDLVFETSELRLGEPPAAKMYTLLRQKLKPGEGQKEINYPTAYKLFNAEYHGYLADALEDDLQHNKPGFNKRVGG